MRSLVPASLASLLLLWAAPARADLTVAAPAEPAPKPRKEWYGGQLLISYAVGDALIGAGVAVEVATRKGAGIPLLVLGGVVRAGAPPLIHLLHKRESMVAWGSLAVQVGTPLVGFALLRLAGPSCYHDKSASCETKEATRMVAGALLGAVVGGAIDAAAIAWGGEPWPRSPKPRVSVVPLPVQGGFGLGVGGVF